jgi:hypothetical protein
LSTFSICLGSNFMGDTSTIQEQDSRPSLVAFGNNVQNFHAHLK